MDYISVKEASALWNIDVSKIGKLCRSGKIAGAKIVARNWLIPKDAPKPVDGRTKQAKDAQAVTVFRFPLFVNFPAESFSPPLSPEEALLRQAQIDFYACDFAKARACFERLCENAQSIYLKICAHFYMCVLAAEYDADISWKRYYFSLNLLLSQDFPHKRETELFFPWLYFILGRFESIPGLLNPGEEYELHPSAWYMNTFLSVFYFQGNYTEASAAHSTEPFGTLCRLMERDGYWVEAQELHAILFAHHYGKLNKEAMEYHLKKLVSIAYEQGLLFAVADAETYYADEIDAVLREYPDSFGEKIRRISKKIYANFARFSEKTAATSVYARLSKQDYRYVFYAIEGFSNKQVAQVCGVSERTVANRYNEIYSKLGISSKQALVDEMGVAFGRNKH